MSRSFLYWQKFGIIPILLTIIVGGVFYRFWFLPDVLKIPADLSLKTDVLSQDNFYKEETRVYAGEQQSLSSLSYRVVSASPDQKQLVIENAFSVKSLAGEDIFYVARQYGVDAHTGQHIPRLGDREREGYLFAPRMKGVMAQVPDKTPFSYWHVNYNVPAVMEFREETVLYGLNTYRYEANFTADQTAEFTGVLPLIGDTRGMSLDVHLELWIEPYTGRIISYQDDTVAYYYDLSTRERLFPWNHFSNRLSPSGITTNVSGALTAKNTIMLVTEYVPAALAAFFCFLLLLWLVSVFAFSRRIFSRPIFVSILVGTFFLGSSVVLWRIELATINAQKERDFQYQTALFMSAITNRFAIYANVLHAGAGLVEASQSVERDEWKLFVENFQLAQKYPGIQGVGYAPFLRADETEIFEEMVRANDLASFNIVPEGDRDGYVPVLYLEPFDARNQRAIGFDMYSEETRKGAINYAIDSADISVSGHVTLVQEISKDVQPGFLMYYPLYALGRSYATTDERREHIQGFVYAPFRARDFIRGILLDHANSNIRLAIYDTADPAFANEDNLLYQDEKISSAPFQTLQTASFFGRTWTFRVASLGATNDVFLSTFIPKLTLALGVIVAIAFGYATYATITRRKRAEEFAELATRDLRQQQARDQAMLLGIGDGLVATDREGVIQMVNHSFTTLLGWTAEEVLGKRLADIVPMVDGAGKVISPQHRLLPRVLRSKKTIFVGGSSHYSYVTKNGELLPVAVSASPVLIDGVVEGVVEVFLDVSKEQAIDRAKTEFVSLASHQLRSPLAAMRWFSEMLLDGDTGKLTAEQTDYVRQIYENVDRMNMLVGALLNVSRIELGTFSIDPKPTNVTQLFKEMLSQQKAAMHDRNVAIKLAIGGNIPNISVDPKLLSIIFQNLLSNAIKYTPDGGSVHISLRVDSKRKKFVFSVKDTGIGIPKEQQSRIFSKLFRADNAKKNVADGNGLGLYIVKQILDQSKGSVTFVSKENVGTTFTVHIPLSGMKSKVGKKTLT